MNPLTKDDKDKIQKILLRINKKLFRAEVIESIYQTIDKLRSGELTLNDWFVKDLMDYKSWAYQWGLHNFVPINST